MEIQSSQLAHPAIDIGHRYLKKGFSVSVPIPQDEDGSGSGAGLWIGIVLPILFLGCCYACFRKDDNDGNQPNSRSRAATIHPTSNNGGTVESDTEWNKKYNILKSCDIEQGKFTPPQGEDGGRLIVWLLRQRALYEASNLSHSRAGKLSELGILPIVVQVVVVVSKPSKDAKLGIGLTDDGGSVKITTLNNDGLFANTLLKVGMRVNTINSKRVTTSNEAVGLLKEAEKQVVIVASCINSACPLPRS